MIRFALRCAQDHAFDSWFRDGASFDALVSTGHVACPVCASTDVSKALMAPAVVTGRKRSAEPPEATPVSPQPQPVAVLDERAQALRAMLREMRDHLVQNSRNVGSQFAEEARRIHEGDADERAIHGTASQDEVRDLLEDGIDVMPLPDFPDDRH